ncbi:MAG: glycosyltransferase [Sphingobacteriaceae bacterium]|nr:MAG: glycosyltransferase [Sphingobacteriaceae bacterium]
MRASFVIATNNRKNEVLSTIAQTKELTKSDHNNYEIVVIDNASTDGSADAIKSNYNGVIIIDNQTNTGVSSRNLGFEIAKGEYLIMLDDDSNIEFGLEEALDFLDRNPQIGVLALNVVNGPYTSALWTDGQESVGFIGCGAIIRREVYKKIGGIAEWISFGTEEWEYGLRVTNAGYEVRYFAGCHVNHRASIINRSNKRNRVNISKYELAIVYKYFSYRKWNYMFRVIGSNIKMVHKVGLKNLWYNLIGMKEFLKIKNTLTPTPVSKEAQLKFINAYITLQNSVFGFLFKKFKS